MSGNTINLVSNDAQKIEKSLNSVGYILSALLEIVINLFILWYLIGWKALVGAAYLLGVAAFQMLMARRAAELRKVVNNARLAGNQSESSILSRDPR